MADCRAFAAGDALLPVKVMAMLRIQRVCTRRADISAFSAADTLVSEIAQLLLMADAFRIMTPDAL